MSVVTRFAPSPTGLLHLGNVRTALLNWLYAKRYGGSFLLRFEDTDQSRSEREYIEAIKADLTWLGLSWDGAIHLQSEHAAKHRTALDSLAEKGLAYRCFCSETRLSLDRKLASSRGLPPRYAGHCRAIPADEAKERAENEPYVWRLAVHAPEGEVTVADALHGDVTFARRDLDDPVVVRSDGSFTFLLPNAVDDALDGITHVLRGDDHLTNSAYQVWLLHSLDYTPPVYLHHGLLLGEDGSKLSKRTGSHSIAELREDGLLPEALLQAMTRLGHPNMPDGLHDPVALADHFNAEHVSTSSVRWSDQEMWRWHTRLLHELDITALMPLLFPYVPDVDSKQLHGFTSLVVRNLELASDAEHFQRLLDAAAPFGSEEIAVVKEAGADFYRIALECWQQLADGDWKQWTNAVKERTACKGRALFMPLRVALSGALHGPEMSAVVDFLGSEEIEIRLRDTIRQAES
ncbi:glutamyl-tRNA synthetase [Mariprofundus ferrinatatus]|uniref:Glutamate--tRNA ligase n=1 Tax=Mariprofundus ferrinatatus TaxID=1921087 RepID=A0A2K8L8R0_9PROT|nr:glutamate--tRNA ligase [Mariprofundus ferrinatatus]ATX81324.1 glutamyl-tRNA synthetase [Mariprofundus ferrinatatus]